MANQVQYGFIDLLAVFDRRVVDVNVRDINEAVDRTLAEHNRQVNALRDFFAQPVTEPTLRYRSAGVRRLQPADEVARALPTQQAGFYTAGFPLQKGMDALGITYEASRKITVQELNNEIAALRGADVRWVRDHILAALLDNTSWTYPDEQYGDITVVPLANGDSTPYILSAGIDAGSTDDHYSAQTAAIADATDPFDDLYDELMEHTENSGQVVAFFNNSLSGAVRSLAAFEAAGDPNIDEGVNAVRLTGALGMEVPGSLIGYHRGKVWLVEWRALPANTVIAVATGGARALGERTHPEADLQGFRRDAERIDYPWYEQQWARRAGYGAWNRVGAAVRQVSGGDTTYDIPTGYATPMP